MTFNTVTILCDHHHSSSSGASSSPEKQILFPWNSHALLPSPHGLWKPQHCYGSLCICLLWKLHIDGFIPETTFGVWGPLQHTMFLDSIICSIYLCWILCRNIHIYLSVNPWWLVGSFHQFSIKNSVSMNIQVQLFVQYLFSTLGVPSQEQNTGRHSNFTFSLLKKHQTVLHSAATYYIPTSHFWEF